MIYSFFYHENLAITHEVKPERKKKIYHMRTTTKNSIQNLLKIFFFIFFYKILVYISIIVNYIGGV